MSKHFCIELPRNIARPEFKLFDVVEVVDLRTDRTTDRGVIVGMRWCSGVDTMQTNEAVGWTYSVSFLMNRTIKEAAEIYDDRKSVLDMVRENRMTLIDEGTSFFIPNRKDIIVKLPDDFDELDFNFLDTVDVDHGWSRAKHHRGTIVGIRYTPAINALAEGTSEGWTYSVSYTRHLKKMSEVRNLDIHFQEIGDIVYPGDMELVQPYNPKGYVPVKPMEDEPQSIKPFKTCQEMAVAA